MQEVRDVRAEDDERPVREVHDVHDPPHEREPERDEREDPAQENRVDEDLPSQPAEAHFRLSQAGIGYRASFSATLGGNTVYLLPVGLELLDGHRLVDVDSARCRT